MVKRTRWLVLLPLLFVLGCAPFSRMWDAATTPTTPRPGPTPLEEIGEGVYHLVMNPFDLSSWLQILGAVGVIGAAGIGAKKAHTKVRRKKVSAIPATAK